MGRFMATQMHEEGGAIFHSWEECPKAQAIPPEHRVAGSGGLPLCEVCRERSESDGDDAGGPRSMRR